MKIILKNTLCAQQTRPIIRSNALAMDSMLRHMTVSIIIPF